MIFVIPMGEYLERTIIDEVEKILRKRFITTTEVVEPIEIPDGTYDVERGQYNAEVLLGRVAPAGDGDYKLCILPYDAYVEGLNFVFGLADVAGRRAMVALARLVHDEPQIFLARIRKEVVHEMGHLHMMGHCRDRKCVMWFSNSIYDTDRKMDMFCPICESKLYRIIGFEIREATIGDVTHIHAIEKVSFKMPWPVAAFVYFIRGYDKHVWVATKGGQVIGYLVFEVEAGGEVHIANIAVHPDYRGMGVGERLMRKLLNKYEGCEVYLEVRVSNRIAQRLYKKLGFEIERTCLNYYPDGEHAYIMRRRLFG